MNTITDSATAKHLCQHGQDRSGRATRGVPANPHESRYRSAHGEQ